MTTPVPVPRTSIVQNDENVKRIEDKFGTQTTRSGQTVDMTITESIVASYSNLMQAPLLATLFFGLLAITLAEYLEAKDGPLEILYNALLNVISSNKNKIFVTVAKIIALLLKFVISQKSWLLNALLISFPYFRKPSTKNLQVTIVFVILAIIFETNYFSVLLFSQVWFLITELRNPKFKMVMGVFVALIFLLSWVDVDPTEKIGTSVVHTQNDQNYPSSLPIVDTPSLKSNQILSLEKFTALTLDKKIEIFSKSNIPEKDKLPYYRVLYFSLLGKQPSLEMTIDELYKNIKKNIPK